MQYQLHFKQKQHHENHDAVKKKHIIYDQPEVPIPY